MAASEGDAKRWVNAIEKIINNMKNLNRQQKSEQYPWFISSYWGCVCIHEVEIFFSVSDVHLDIGTVGIFVC